MNVKKFRTTEEKQALIKGFLSSGKLRTVWCKETNIPVTTFVGWMKADEEAKKLVRMLILPTLWIPFADTILSFGGLLYGGILAVSAAIEYGVGTAQTYGFILRDHAIQTAERIFGSGVATGSEDIA